MLRRYVSRRQLLKEWAGDIAGIIAVLMIGGVIVMGLLTLVACIWAAASVNWTIQRISTENSRSGIEKPTA